MRTFRLTLLLTSVIVGSIAFFFFVFSNYLSISVNSCAYLFIIAIISFAVMLFTLFKPGGVTPDECTLIDIKLNLGYTRQDLLDEGFTNCELNDYEFLRWRDIPTTSPEEEKKES